MRKLKLLIAALAAAIAVAAPTTANAYTCGTTYPCPDPTFPMTKTDLGIRTWMRYVGNTYPINIYWGPYTQDVNDASNYLVASKAYLAGSSYQQITFDAYLNMFSAYSGITVSNETGDAAGDGIPTYRCWADWQVTYNRYWTGPNADGSHDAWILVQARDGSHNPDMGNSGGWKCKVYWADAVGQPGSGQILQY